MGHKREAGFTLVELMIVVVVATILAAIAYPAYTNQVRKSRRADAQAVLVAFGNAMERYFTTNVTYLGAATGGANTGAPRIFATEAPLDGSIKYYDLTIQGATATTYTLRATPKGTQVGDGILELTGAGFRGWDRNGNGSTSDAGENIWY
jgi:prepilin-type N-terminal cleavage/methylation domain